MTSNEGGEFYPEQMSEEEILAEAERLAREEEERNAKER